MDTVTRPLISSLQSVGVSPTIIADELKALVDTGPLRKISICEGALSELGFEQLPKNWAWFCGDLCY